MIPHKKYEKKPLAHSARDLEVLAHVEEYVIRTNGREVTHVDPGQALAAILAAKANDLKCLVYARGMAHGELCLALVDEDWLHARVADKPKKQAKSRAQELCEELFVDIDEKRLATARNLLVTTFMADSPGDVAELALAAEAFVKTLDETKRAVKGFLKRNKREIEFAKKKRA